MIPGVKKQTRVFWSVVFFKEIYYVENVLIILRKPRDVIEMFTTFFLNRRISKYSSKNSRVFVGRTPFSRRWNLEKNSGEVLFGGKKCKECGRKKNPDQ